VRALIVAALVLLAGCEKPGLNAQLDVPGGDPSRAPQVMRYYGCPTCHTIAGVPTPTGTIGPPLKDFKKRAYIGGVLSNSADNLVQWIRDPQKFSPRTDMPKTGISEEDAKHVAAYLYSQ
jgi:cytochrome c